MTVPCVGPATSVVDTLSGETASTSESVPAPLSAMTLPVIDPKFGPLKLSGCATAALSTETTRTYEVAARLVSLVASVTCTLNVRVVVFGALLVLLNVIRFSAAA